MRRQRSRLLVTLLSVSLLLTQLDLAAATGSAPSAPLTASGQAASVREPEPLRAAGAALLPPTRPPRPGSTAATSGGVLARYYPNGSWSGPPGIARIDATVDFDWSGGHPFGAPDFSVVWSGWITAPASGTYTFGLDSDDGSTLAIGGSLTVNNGGAHSEQLVTGTTNLTAGTSYPVVVRYFECCGGPAMMHLQWTPPGGSGLTVVPSSALSFSSGPDALQTLGTGQGPWGSDPTLRAAEPVNTATGNYLSQTTDLALPGRGLGVAFTRTYNSLATASGPLGLGWTHSYAAHLVLNPDGSIMFVADDAATFRYESDAVGGYVGPGGAFGSLSAVSGGYELLRRDQVRYHFNATGALISETDRNGNALTLAYTGGDLTTITDTVGRVATLSYDASHRLTGLAAPLGRSVSYTYDAAGRLASVTDLRGGVTRYTYDSAGRLATIIDPNTHTVVTNEYGADGRISAQTDARGNRSTFAWNAATQTSTFTDARGGTWVDVYVGNVLQSHRDPLGNTTSYAYDVNFDRTSVTDPRGNVTTYAYDAIGNLTSRTAPTPLSYVESWTFTALNDVASYTDRRGNTTSYAYNPAGNRTSMTQPGNAVTSYGRDPGGTGLLTSVTDPRGKTTILTYDAQANLASSTSPLGNKTTFGYDGAGRLLTTVDPRGNVSGANPTQYTTTYAYDAADHVASVTDPLGNTTTTAYDPAANRTSVTDPLGHATSFGYDAGNHLTSVTDAAAKVTSYTYDATSDLVTRTDANTHTTTYAYDLAARLTSTTDPAGHVSSLTYDAAGNVATRTDANGKTTTYTYDALNRTTGLTYADSSTAAVTYAYDANSNRTSMTDGAGTETFAYDSLDRLLSDSRGTDVFGYTFDAAGDIVSRTYPDGTTTSYSFDANGRLASATFPVTTPPGLAHRQDAGNQISTAATSMTVTLPAAATAGDALILAVGINLSTVSVSSVTGAGGSWNRVIAEPGHGTTTETWAALNVSGGSATITITFSASAKGAAEVSEFSGVVSASATDATGAATDGSVTALSSGSATTTNATDVVVAAVGWRQGAAPTASPTSPWTAVAAQTNSFVSAASAWRITSATGAYSASWTLGAATPGYDGTIVALKGAGPAADTTAPTTPTGVVASAVSPTQVNLSWTASTDNVAVTAYTIYRGGAKLSVVAGSVTSFTDHSPVPATAYAYTVAAADAAANASAQSAAANATTPSLTATTAYAYDPAGNLVSSTGPNGVTEVATYDRAARLLEIANTETGGTLSRFTYAYDAAGNRIELTTSLGTTYYGYDLVNRLLSACTGGSCVPPGGQPLACLACVTGTIARPAASISPNPSDTLTTYAYDPVGNRASLTTYLGTTTYSYDVADRLTATTGPGATAYTYDANGNERSAGTTTYSYDLADRLVSASVGGTTQTYTYSGDGLRRSAATGAGAASTTFLVDRSLGLPSVAIERDGTGAVVRRSLYGVGRIGIESAAGVPTYEASDGLGSVTDLSAPSGSSLAWSEYGPYGQLRSAGGAGAAADPFAFTGQYLDTPTGLYHLRARQYDPGTGRFLTTDPLTASISDPYVASYAYTRGNPMGYTDPSGRCPWCVFGAVVGFVSYTAGVVAANVVKGNTRDLGHLLSGWNVVDAAISTGAGAITGGLATPSLALTTTEQVIAGTVVGFDATVWSMNAGGRRNPIELIGGTAAGGLGPLLPGGGTTWTGSVRGIVSGSAVNTAQNLIASDSATPWLPAGSTIGK
jgi:RHS repeat-associated protein